MREAHLYRALLRLNDARSEARNDGIFAQSYLEMKRLSAHIK